MAGNAYLFAQIERGALEVDHIAGPIVGYWHRESLEGIAIFGTNLVLSTPCSTSAAIAFAEFAQRQSLNPWVAFASDVTMQRFMEAYGEAAPPILSKREQQVLFELELEELIHDPSSTLRPADISELEELIVMDRAMVQEELGFDPFARDLESYRRGWKRRVREGRCWVATEEGRLVFKVDHSAVSQQVVQLAGVYTVPSHRRRGVARHALSCMVRLLCTRGQLVSLYVDRGNAPAIALYAELGFTASDSVTSIWFSETD